MKNRSSKSLFLILVALVSFFKNVVFSDDFLSEDTESLDNTASNNFILDVENSGGDVQLQFGSTLAEYLKWNSVTSQFEISNNLNIFGNLEVSGNVFTLDADNSSTGSDVSIVANQGTDNDGIIRYNASTNEWEFSNDGASFTPFGSGTVNTFSSNDIIGQFYDSVGGLNINVASPVAIGFNQEVRKDSGITHDTVTNNSQVVLDSAGWYEVSYDISYTNGTNGRKNIGCYIQLDGTTMVPGSVSYSYVRNSTDNFGSNSARVIFETTVSNQYYEVLCTQGGSAGAATTIADESNTFVKKLDMNGGGGAPYITSTELLISPSDTETISIEGIHFTPDSTVAIPGFPGTINTVSVISPTQIDVNLTSTSTIGSYDVVVTSSGISNTDWSGNGVGLLDVNFVSGTGSAGTYTESFETDFGSWVDSGLDVTWTRDSGGTPSGNTGPTVASDGTFYVFTEASNPNFPGRTFGLETTDFGVAQSISFDYHMFGADMGTLEVQTLRSGVWTTRATLAGQQQGTQGAAYLNQFVDLSIFEVEAIRLFYTSGANYTGDCTIDNIIIISS